MEIVFVKVENRLACWRSRTEVGFLCLRKEKHGRQLKLAGVRWSASSTGAGEGGPRALCSIRLKFFEGMRESILSWEFLSIYKRNGFLFKF